MPQRETFGSRFAVIMAMAGSAIGLGNIWRFPYMVGQWGGAAFILVYALSCLVLALPIFYAETLIGRRSRRNTVGAMQRLAPGTHWRWLGLLTIISPVLILGYYSVVGGWSVEYLFKSLAFDFSAVPDEAVTGFFTRFISSTWQPILTHTLFLAAVAFIVLAGVKRGIEQFTKVTMPLLFVLVLAIAVFSLTLPGSSAGVRYLLQPDFSKLNGQAVTAAMGQAFFSLSLGVGTILTYASYMDARENIFTSGIGTAVSDLGFALLAGFAIMPAVFSAGIAPEAGPGLVFQTLPYIFNQMGGHIPWLGAVISILFFVSILVAALTSAISMLEVGVAYLTEEKGLSRGRAVWLLTLFIWLLGILCSLSFGQLSWLGLFGSSIFDFLDKLCSNFLLPLGGLLFTLFVGWWMPEEEVRDEFTSGGQLPLSGVYRLVRFLIRYVAPLGIFAVFLSNLLS